MTAAVVEQHGRIDTLVNVAGGTVTGAAKPGEEITTSSWAQSEGPFFLSTEVGRPC